MPPGTAERHEFVELVKKDLGKALLVSPDWIEILTVKPALGIESNFKNHA